MWKSDEWPDPAAGPAPEAYRAPLLVWFRGLDADMTMYNDRVVLHASLDMQRKATEPKKSTAVLQEFVRRRQEPDPKKPAVPPPPPPGEVFPAPEAVKTPPGEKAVP